MIRRDQHSEAANANKDALIKMGQVEAISCELTAMANHKLTER
jgi:hypothetical protein